MKKEFIKIPITKAIRKLKETKDPFVLMKERGTLEIELYKPEGKDFQQPHKKDEVYIVVKGIGKYKMEDEIVEFKAGDVLFAPAGAEHRFIDFSEDFMTWVIFYGPEGGEIKF